MLSISDAVFVSDAVILPLPMTLSDGNINAPYSKEIISPDELARAIPIDMPVLCGMPHRAFVRHNVYDYAFSEEFLIANAALTAESAVALAALELQITLLGANTLIVGYGRIAKPLARLLMAFGAHVTVAARRASDRAYAKTLGCAAIDTSEIFGAGAFDAVFNTVPERILGPHALDAFGPGCLLMELASAPGGFDPDAARARDIKVLHAGGLPGKYSPKSAAKIIYNAVEELLPKK
jgi:dipicolinate synthase subunit A